MLRVIYVLIPALIIIVGSACHQNDLDPNELLDEQLADIEGRYVGAIRYWYVEPGTLPFDTTWSVNIDTFSIGIGRDANANWMISAVIPIRALGHSKFYQYDKTSGNPLANFILFPLKMPEEFYFDERVGQLTARRNPFYIEGFYYRSVYGPTSYGVIYEGEKVD